MKQAFLSSSLIIARSGYSTIMDLAALGKKAIFIPTPGQTEQEYLAKHFMLKKVAYSQPQHVFNLLQAIEESKQYSGFSYTAESGLEKQLEFILTTP